MNFTIESSPLSPNILHFSFFLKDLEIGFAEIHIWDFSEEFIGYVYEIEDCWIPSPYEENICFMQRLKGFDFFENFLGEKSLFLHKISINENIRKSGFGTIALRLILDFAKERMYNRIFLHCFDFSEKRLKLSQDEKNIRLCSWYERFGFYRISDSDDIFMQFDVY